MVTLLQNSPGCSEKTVTLDIQNGKTAATVTIFKETLLNFFDEQIVDSDSQLKMALLNLTNVDFTIGKNSKVVSLEHHTETEQ